MTREDVLRILSSHTEEFAALGVKRLALFGSTARNEAGPESDVDILVDLGDNATFDRYCAVYDALENTLPCRVDLGTFQGLRPRVWPYVQEDLVDVLLHTAMNCRASTAKPACAG